MIEPTERPFKSELEASSRDEKKLALVDEAKRLKEKGKSVREIADALGIATGTAHKYLKIDAESLDNINGRT